MQNFALVLNLASILTSEVVFRSAEAPFFTKGRLRDWQNLFCVGEKIKTPAARSQQNCESFLTRRGESNRFIKRSRQRATEITQLIWDLVNEHQKSTSIGKNVTFSRAVHALNTKGFLWR